MKSIVIAGPSAVPKRGNPDYVSLTLDCRVASEQPKFILSACKAVEGLLAMTKQPNVGCSQESSS